MAQNWSRMAQIGQEYAKTGCEWSIYGQKKSQNPWYKVV